MTRTAHRLIASVVFVIAGLGFAIAAAAEPIFPPLVSGEYRLRIRTGAVELDAEGIPTRAPTRSAGLRLAEDPLGPVLACVDAGPGELVSISVTVPAAGDRAELRGFAFAEAGCTGEESDPSDNGAYVFFTPPAPPTLELEP